MIYLFGGCGVGFDGEDDFKGVVRRDLVVMNTVGDGDGGLINAWRYDWVRENVIFLLFVGCVGVVVIYVYI